MSSETLYLKICVNKSNGQKFVTIPKKSDLKPGDYVEVNKADN